SFGQRPHAGLEFQRVSIELIVRRAVTHRHTAPTCPAQGLRLAVAGTILDQKTLVERNSVVSAPLIRAIQRLPVPSTLLDESQSPIEEYNQSRKSANPIKAVEGHYRNTL